MKKSNGMEIIVFTRDAKNAMHDRPQPSSHPNRSVRFGPEQECIGQVRLE
jgi:hypothetical protein